MAMCLRKQFISCGSFAFVGRRNHQTSCFDQKTSNANPHSKEVITCDYLPLTTVRSSRSPRMRVSVEACPNNWPKILGTNSVSHLKDISLDICTVKKPNALGLDDSLMYCVSECTATKSVNNNPVENESGKPTETQLEFISDKLSKDLTNLFVRSMDFRIYHSQFIFENNIRGTKSGLAGYISEMAVLRLLGHIKFAQINFKILKLTTHPEDGTVRMRWRIIGVSNYSAFFQFWKHKPQKTENFENWYDGFSIFYVRSDGLVHKHTADKMMPDSEGKVVADKNNLAAKMAFAVGLVLEDFPLRFLKKIPKKHPEVLRLSKQLEF